MKTTEVDGTDKPLLTTSLPKFNNEPARQVKPRKRAADFLSDDEDEDDEKVDKPNISPSTANPATNQEKHHKKKKRSKKGSNSTAAVQQPPNPDAPSLSVDVTEKNKLGKAEKKDRMGHEMTEIADQSSSHDAPASEEEFEDNMTSALIKGFESSGDEDMSGNEGLKPGQNIPTIPDSKKIKKRLLKIKKTTDESEEPGTVYIG